MQSLPAPATATEQFLAAVHAELVGLRADLARRGGERPVTADGRIELREPEAAGGGQPKAPRAKS